MASGTKTSHIKMKKWTNYSVCQSYVFIEK